jgi:hypothetical protein
MYDVHAAVLGKDTKTNTRSELLKQLTLQQNL